MAGKRWITATFAAITIALAGSRAPAQATQNQTQPAGLSQADVDAYFDGLRKSVGEGSSQQRLDAAKRLVESPEPRARDHVTALLSGADERVQFICAEAIAECTAPNSVWIYRLAPLLDREPGTSEIAAKALARYDGNKNAVDALIKAATTAPMGNRIAIIGALGSMIQKPAAQILVSIVIDASQSPELRNAADASLTRLSGQTPAGGAASFWSNWLASREPLQPTDWRKSVLEEQHATLQGSESRLRDRLAQFRDRVNNLELQRYTVEESPTKKSAILLQLLNDSDPDIRIAGTFVATDAINAAVQQLSPEVRARLFSLVGDPSADVRRAVANVLTSLGDPNGLKDIFLQFQIEPDLQVKLALVKAIARTGDRSLPILQRLIREAPPVIAAAAADAISTAPFQGKAQLRAVVDFLRAARQERTGPIGNPSSDLELIDLRAHLVRAIATLSVTLPGPDTINDLASLTDRREPVAVRQAALLGLGTLGPPAGEVVGNLVQGKLNPNDEPDPLIRAAAATALGNMGSFVYYTDIDSRTQSQNEPSPEVRAAAREACRTLLQAGTAQQLPFVITDLKKRQDWVRALEALQIRTQKLSTTKNDEAQALAIDREDIGDIYAEKLNSPGQAIDFYRQALAYYQQPDKHPEQFVTDKLIGKLLRAYLAANQFDAALQFSAEQLADPRTQTTIGSEITNWASRLSQPGASAESVARARALIKMTLDLKSAGKLEIGEDQRQRLEVLRDGLPPVATTSPAK